MLHVQTQVYPQAVVLHLEGRFDYHSMDTFLPALSQAEKSPNPPHIVLALHNVIFIDSMAIGRLVGTWHRLRRDGIRFTLTGQVGYVDDALKLMKLEAMIPTVKTVEDALAMPLLTSSPERNPNV
ncbi:MAG: STAS domain-containing protein [Nitrospirales bacterium]|nr:STAS domain-containing protein [Nitrospirales bacterium]